MIEISAHFSLHINFLYFSFKLFWQTNHRKKCNMNSFYFIVSNLINYSPVKYSIN